MGSGLRIEGLGSRFWVGCVRPRVHASDCRAEGSSFWGFRVQAKGLRFRTPGLVDLGSGV